MSLPRDERGWRLCIDPAGERICAAGPGKCRGVITDYRVDGYCSVECRDWHEREDKHREEIEKLTKNMEKACEELEDLRNCIGENLPSYADSEGELLNESETVEQAARDLNSMEAAHAKAMVEAQRAAFARGAHWMMEQKLDNDTPLPHEQAAREYPMRRIPSEPLAPRPPHDMARPRIDCQRRE